MKSHMQMFQYQGSIIRYVLTDSNRLPVVPPGIEREVKEAFFYVSLSCFLKVHDKP